MAQNASDGKRRFGDCMWRRHEYCRVTLENGTKCECDCDSEAHGSKYVPGIVDTPMHRMLIEAGEKNGYTMTGFGDTVETAATADTETIDDLEKKRAKDVDT